MKNRVNNPEVKKLKENINGETRYYRRLTKKPSAESVLRWAIILFIIILRAS